MNPKPSIGAAAIMLLAFGATVSACPECRALTSSGVYDRDFFANLLMLLCPVLILLAIGITIYHADEITGKIKGGFSEVANEGKRSPLIAAGILMGAGLGGFVDGIVFHQILQLHNMLSARLPPDNLVAAKINMTWDGYFHAAVWVMTAVGLALLWRAGARRDVAWSGLTFMGSLLAGWGLFNLIEGVIDHLLLNIHHVYEYANNKLAYDLAFLASGILLLLVGGALIKSGRADTAPRGER